MKRDETISRYYDDYIQKRMLGEKVEKEDFLLTVPDGIREDVRGDIEGWEELVGWKYTGSADDIDDTRIEILLESVS